MSSTRRALTRTVLAAACLAGDAQALEKQQKPAQQDIVPARRDIDLVIALDVSGSMSGLIDSTKQRLWDIVNELGRAQPTPVLRVAILTYGAPDYGAQSGYVRLDLPFTSDLDAVNEKLFSFQTNGGDEYVARVVHTAFQRLQWSQAADALRIVFVAGNESAAQDPQLRLEQVMNEAAQRDIVVNAIYCGGNNDEDAAGWRRVATLANGTYASIDQNAAAVANVATPYDAQLASLNEALNATYLALGATGERARKNQVAQDANAAAMSAPAAASRALAKAGALYETSWDLVSAVAAGMKLEDVATADLPPEMRDMEPAEREEYVEKKAAERAELQTRIQSVGQERRQYIEAHSERAGDALDTAMLDGVHQAAERKGFEFPD
jgi:hypothetical protein